MATIQVKDLDEDVRDIFAQRAAQAGQSLQQYMRRFLTEVARTKTNAELFAQIEQDARRARRAGKNTSVDFADIVQELRHDRENR